jgi:N-acetylated-alpha-linked acidic dipeptidase
VLKKSGQGGFKVGDESRQQLAQLLRGMEQSLLKTEGLPGREWFRPHDLRARVEDRLPAKTLPGVREAIDDRRWPEAERYAAILGEVLNGYCNRLDQIGKVLTN